MGEDQEEEIEMKTEKGEDREKDRIGYDWRREEKYRGFRR